MNFDDVIAGWRYSATLSTRTPLQYLEREGEFVEGPEQPPLVGPEENHLENGVGFNSYGIWLQVIQWPEDFTPPPPGRRAAAGGMVQIGSKEEKNLISFLKDYRRIVESNESIDCKIQALKDLSVSSPENSTVWEKLSKYSSLIDGHFCGELEFQLPEGMGTKKAEALYFAGFRTIDEIRMATDNDLLAVKGIGKGLVRKLRS